ncbi:hypothetical protein D3C76_1656590 [compost metagenome]
MEVKPGSGNLYEQGAGTQQQPVEVTGTQQMPRKIVKAPAKALRKPEGSYCQRIDQNDMGDAPFPDIAEAGEQQDSSDRV